MERAAKKRVTLAAIIIAVICVVGAGIYFAAPYIKNVTDPNNKAIQGMKNSSIEVSDNIKAGIDNIIKGITDGESKVYTGYITYDDLTYKSDNMLDYIKTNTIRYNYGIDGKSRAIGGSILLAPDEDGADVASLDFYIDDKALYFKVPQLSSYNYKMSLEDVLNNLDKSYVGTGSSNLDIGFDKGDIDYMMKLLDSVDKEEGDSYSKAIQSVVDDIQKGLAKAAEEFTYSKLGNKEYSRDSYKQNTTCYNVTVTKDALIDGADAAIEAIYDDDSISGYRTLISSYYKNSREKLKSAVRKHFENFEGFDMTIYVGDGNRIVAYEINNNDDNGNGAIVIESFLKGQITNLAYNVSYKEDTAALTFERADENTYKISSQINSSDIRLSYHGQAGLSDDNKFTVSAADFTNAIDVAQLTNSQYQAIVLEAMSNIKVLNQIISIDSFIQ